MTERTLLMVEISPVFPFDIDIAENNRGHNCLKTMIENSAIKVESQLLDHNEDMEILPYVPRCLRVNE
jgi:hypothetical protein